MRLKVIGIIALSSLLFSCKHTKNDLMVGSWKGAKFENPDMDSFFVQSQHYIDTIGKGNSDMTNWELYNVTNIDSLRKVLQQQHDSAKMMQGNAVRNTIFNFRKDSMALISFNGSLDTSKWYLENDSMLVMEEMTGAEKGVITKIAVVTLTEKEMKLKFQQENSFSTVTFLKDKK